MTENLGELLVSRQLSGIELVRKAPGYREGFLPGLIRAFDADDPGCPALSCNLFADGLIKDIQAADWRQFGDRAKQRSLLEDLCGRVPPDCKRLLARSPCTQSHAARRKSKEPG